MLSLVIALGVFYPAGDSCSCVSDVIACLIHFVECILLFSRENLKTIETTKKNKKERNVIKEELRTVAD